MAAKRLYAGRIKYVIYRRQPLSIIRGYWVSFEACLGRVVSRRRGMRRGM